MNTDDSKTDKENIFKSTFMSRSELDFKYAQSLILQYPLLSGLCQGLSRLVSPRSKGP